VNETWMCQITPNDLNEDGGGRNSTLLSILEDTCSAPASEIWKINCADNCTWTSNQSVLGNVTITNTGTLNLSAYWNFTGSDQYVTIEDSSCELDIYPDAGFA